MKLRTSPSSTQCLGKEGQRGGLKQDPLETLNFSITAAFFDRYHSYQIVLLQCDWIFSVVEARMLGFPQECRRSQAHFAFCLDVLVLIPFKATRRSRKLDRLVMEDRSVPLAVSWTTLWCFYSPSWGIKCLRQCPKPSQTACLYPVALSKGIPKCWLPFPSQDSRVSSTWAEEAVAFLKTLLFPRIPERLPRALLDSSGSPSDSLLGVKPLLSA